MAWHYGTHENIIVEYTKKIGGIIFPHDSDN